MRIFPDSNVLVAAQVWPNGVCAALLAYLLATPNHELAIGELVFHETRRVLAERFQVPQRIITRFEARLRTGSTTIGSPEAPEDLPVSVRNPADARILASDLALGTDVLVTGDKDLLVLRDQLREIQILTPREVYDQMRTNEPG